MRRSVLYLKISFYIPIYIPRDVASGGCGGYTRNNGWSRKNIQTAKSRAMGLPTENAELFVISCFYFAIHCIFLMDKSCGFGW